jgi:hypothetical protein
MKSEAELLEMVRSVYAEMGGDPEELVRLAPLYGGWYNALKFELVRADNAKAVVLRKDLESVDQKGIKASLKAFSAPKHR